MVQAPSNLVALRGLIREGPGAADGLTERRCRLQPEEGRHVAAVEPVQIVTADPDQFRSHG